MFCPSRAFRHIAFSLGAALLLACAGQTAHADEFPRLFESARGLAMGDSLTALASSFEAMFYNPAGIAQTETWRVRASYWEEQSDDNGELGGKEFFEALDKLGGKDPVIAEGFLSAVADNPQSVRTQSMAGFHTGGGFGLVWVDSSRLQTRAAESVPSPSLNLTYDRISGALMTFGFASDLRLFMWGFTLKYLKREAAVRNVPPNVLTVPAFDAQFGTVGDAEFDADFGILGRLPFPGLRPTLGIAILNLRSPDFGLPDVPPLKKEINIGLSLQPDILPDVAKLIISLEQRDVSGSAFEDEAARRRNNWGVELSFYPQTPTTHLLNIWMGSNQEQESFGVGANLSHYASLAFVAYREELGEGSHRSAQKRRLIEFKLGF